MTGKLRLHQFLSKSGKFPNKQKLMQAISCGEISVNQAIIVNPQHHVRKNSDIRYQGKKLELVCQKEYIIINKPIGYLCSKLSKEDIRLRKKSIYSILKDAPENILSTIVCVGRLDEDTSGLLIMTNDGDLVEKITRPESNITKKYKAKLINPITQQEKKQLESGISIMLETNGTMQPYKTRPCKIEILDQTSQNVTVTVTEGKKREVRRMFESTGNKVKMLQRTAIGDLELSFLKIKTGQYARINKELIDEKIFGNKKNKN